MRQYEYEQLLHLWLAAGESVSPEWTERIESLQRPVPIDLARSVAALRSAFEATCKVVDRRKLNVIDNLRLLVDEGIIASDNVPPSIPLRSLPAVASWKSLPPEDGVGALRYAVKNMQFFVRGKRSWVPIPDVFVFEWRAPHTASHGPEDETLAPPAGTLTEWEYRAILGLQRAVDRLPWRGFTEVAPELSERLSSCRCALENCQAERSYGFERSAQMEEEEFLVAEGILTEPYGSPVSLGGRLEWEPGVKSMDSLPADDPPMTYRYVVDELAYFVRGNTQWVCIADPRVLEWEWLSERSFPSPMPRRKPRTRLPGKRGQKGENDISTGSGGGRGGLAPLVFWQQASDWDCVPVTILNALRLLFPNRLEELGSIPGDVVARVWHCCLDSLPRTAKAPVGTTREGLKALAGWLNRRRVSLADIPDDPEFEVTATLLAGARASRRIIEGPSLPETALCVRLQWCETEKSDPEGHYVLFLDDDEAEGWVYLFDPYPVRPPPPEADPRLWHPLHEVGARPDFQRLANVRVCREHFRGKGREHYQLGPSKKRECFQITRSKPPLET